MIRSLLIFTLALSQLASAKDPQLEGPGLDVALISDSRSITPGVPLTVGFHIRHHTGFHTYWKGPGMVGVPTSLKWTLPEGFSASEIRWPHPEITFMAEYPCHGYERDVTLLVTITPPKQINSKAVTLKTDANWMCCAKGCFPNSQSFEITLPVTQAPVPDSTSAALIQTATNELPKTNSKLRCSVRGYKQIELKFFFPRSFKAEEIYFFSSDGQVSSDQAQALSRGIDGAVILTMQRSEFSPKKFEALPGVLKIGKQYFEINPAYPKELLR